MPSIFISYIRENSHRVNWLVNYLKGIDDIDVWYDQSAVQPGDKFMDEARDAIEKSDYFLPVFSKEFSHKLKTRKKFYMYDELKHAEKVFLDEKRKNWIIPITLDETQIEKITNFPWLYEIDYVDLKDDSKKELYRLLATIGVTPTVELKGEGILTNAEKYWLYRDYLFQYNDIYSRAINLWGFGDDFVTEDRLDILYCHTQYQMPQELEKNGIEHLDELKKSRLKLFDGPCIRLSKFKENVVDDHTVGKENTKLEIELAPINWFDYIKTNDLFRFDVTRDTFHEEYQDEKFYGAMKYIDENELVNGDVSASRLSNITETISTIVSNDGYIGYQERQAQSIGEYLYTGGVAENMNRFLDEVHPVKHEKILNTPNSRNIHHLILKKTVLKKLQTHNNVDTKDYSPQNGNIPHPFITVRRGIAEELSVRLLSNIHPKGIKMIGISFDLMIFHPNFLFAVFVDLPYREILEIIKNYPGKHRREGRVRFMNADFHNKTTNEILKRKNWVPASLAAMLRTMQLLSAVSDSNILGEYDFSWAFYKLKN